MYRMRNFRARKNLRNRRLPVFLVSLFQKNYARQSVIIVLTVTTAQIASWYLFETFLETKFPVSHHVFIEVTFLTVSLLLILLPVLYYFSYRPLFNAIKNLQITQEQLKNLNQELVVTSEAERKAHQLASTLLAANQALSQSLDLDAIAETLLDFLFDFVPFDGASILMPATQGTWIVLKSIRCLSGKKVEIQDSQIFDVASAKYLKEFIAEKQSVLISDTLSCKTWQPLVERKESRSWLGLPFIADGSVIGICEVYKTHPNFFTVEHIKMSEMLTRVAAKALQNAWLFEQVQAGRQRLQSLSHRLVNVQEVERKYIARELHDEAGQGLASLLIGLRLLERNVHNPSALVTGIDELKCILNEVSDGLHGLAIRLRPASLDHLGVVPILTQHIEDFAKKHDIDAQFETINMHGRLPLEMETAVYRIVQEGLTNILRHAKATRADILLQNRDNKLVIIVEDNGIGFIPEIVKKSEHLGLVGIEERAEMLNGKMTIESTPGAGTTLIVEVPYEAAHIDS